MNIDKQYTNVDKLTADLMNIPHRHTLSHFTTVAEYKAYKEGHCDARHAAVEVVLEHAQQDAALANVEMLRTVRHRLDQGLDEYPLNYEQSLFLQDLLLCLEKKGTAVALSDAKGKAAAANADGLKLPAGFAWPEPPKRSGQSHVLFDDGYVEGWAKAIDTVRAMFATSAADAKDAERLKWISHAWTGQQSDYAQYILQRGGNGDLSDIRTFVDAQQAQSSANGGDATGGQP